MARETLENGLRNRNRLVICADFVPARIRGGVNLAAAAFTGIA
jgi:hypothetical protein